MPRSVAASRVAAAGILLLFAFPLKPAVFPDPSIDDKNVQGEQTAVLAGGCFWCVEAVFQQIAGVKKVVSGYSGGDAASAHYDIVSTGTTGHAESVQVTFDPRKITYGQVLKVFFDVAHDPTQLNRQGPDRGPQYRSVIFYSNAEQKKIAEAYIRQLDQAKVFRSPIVTQVVELKAFYPAEEHHQNFCNRNPRNPYVLGVAMPKVEKVRHSGVGKRKVVEPAGPVAFDGQARRVDHGLAQATLSSYLDRVKSQR